MAGEQLDLSSEQQAAESGRTGEGGRPFVGVRFHCCDVYTRVYINRDHTAYEGRCPRCLRCMRLQIGPGGTDQRFFSVG